MKLEHAQAAAKNNLPIATAVIDLRYVTLVPKLEALIGRHASVSASLGLGTNSEGFSDLELARFLTVQNGMCGHDIEK